MKTSTACSALSGSCPAVALAVALLVGGSSPAQAQFFSTSGANNSSPVDLIPTLNPSAPLADFTGNTLIIGNGAAGSFAAMAGGLLRADRLTIALGGANGSMTVTGAGTRVELGGAGDRLVVGDYGTGSLLVSAGAVVDGTINANACIGISGCGNTFIGSAAGSTASLTITGAGSELRALRYFGVGHSHVFNPDFGTPGGTTQASIDVLNGGLLSTWSSSVGVGPNTPDALGTEQGHGTVTIDGAGSRWQIGPNTLDNTAAGLTIGSGINGTGTLTVRNGGQVRIDGTGGVGPNDFVNIGSGGAHGTVVVTGVGSSFDVIGLNTVLQVGRSGASGQGSFSLLAGATASALYVNVARDGALGTLLIDGAGSQLSQVGVGTAIGTNTGGAAFANVGRDGGVGAVTVSNGGRWLITDGGQDSRAGNGSPGFALGRGVNGNGSLTITGPGSRVEVVSNSLGLAPGVPDNFNPFVAIGYDSGSPGQLSISNGGQLLLTGNALSTPTDTRVTALHIGGRSNTSANHLGSATVSGAGSQILLNGADALINVGRGPGSVGTLDVTSGGHVGSISLVVGAFGNGSVSLDGGSIALSGQRTDSTNVGAGMTIGRGNGGVGVMTLANGSSLSFQNNGTLDIGFSVGGDGFASGGTGTLLVSGGSSITLAGSVGGGASIGRTGSGTLALSGNSLLDVGSNRSIYVGRDAAGSGALSVFSGSSVNAGYVGVGSTTGGDTGGGALLVVDNSSLTATTLEIGTTGMLSGDEGTINANVLNRGILSPGNSPGRIIINGGFHNLVGGRLVLDVDEVAGEFQVDHLVLTAGSSFGFDDVTVTFNFIGDTDPEAFAASGGFDLDNFIQSSDSNGNVSGLSTVFEPDASWETVFASAQFEAASPTYDVTQLSLTQDGSFGVVAVPVPEPQTVILWLAGLGLLSAVRLLQRRR